MWLLHVVKLISMNDEEKLVEDTAPRKLIDYTMQRGDKNHPPFRFKNKMYGSIVVATTPTTATPVEERTRMLSCSSSFSKNLPACRRDNSSTLLSSWMHSLNEDYRPPCPRSSIEDLRDSNKHPLGKRRLSHSIASRATARKRDSMRRRSRSADQLCYLSGDGDGTKDIHCSSVPPPEESRSTKSLCSWEEEEEMLVDFYLKIPSQTSIQHRTRSDLRQRYQIQGRTTRRVGTVQSLFTTSTSGKSKSIT